MPVIEDLLSSIKVPLSVAVVATAGAIGGFVYLNDNYVHAEDFRAFQQTLETRSLERDKNALEREVLKLEVKADHYPEKFDAVDKALLGRQKEDLQEIKKELKDLKERQLNQEKKW